MRQFGITLLFALAFHYLCPTSLAAPLLELKDNDRIILLGNTFIERDRHYGQIETMMRSRFSGKKFAVRNMAWPGDTTTVQLRPLNFGTLRKHLQEYNPTVAFLAFGGNDAFEGGGNLEEFLSGYQRLIRRLKRFDARIVLISPIRHETLGPPFPDPSQHNKNISTYSVAIRSLAQEHGLPFVDLFSTLIHESDAPPDRCLTENGIHLNIAGYRQACDLISQQLGWNQSSLHPAREEKLRLEIVRKDKLFFHRWRAHNGEYIYGRRSKKGGGNAGNPTFSSEMAEFDRLLKESDALLAEMSALSQ